MGRTDNAVFWSVIAGTLVACIGFAIYTDIRSRALQRRVEALIEAEELKDDQKTQATGVSGLRP